MMEEKLARLEAENEQLANEKFELSSNLRQMSVELEAFRRDSKKSAERLLAADKEADELNKAAAYKYMLELKSLKVLAQKYLALYKDEIDSQKAEKSKLILESLSRLDNEGYFGARALAEGLDKKLFGGEVFKEQEGSACNDFDEFILQNHSAEAPVFDLEEAINPTTPLDLKELLKELGI